MERAVVIDGRQVRFRASASVLRLYRIQFRRDLLQDMAEISRAVKAADSGGSSIPVEVLGLFENVAYVMAKHADPAVPDTAEEWLDGFGVFSIYQIFPVILELWGDGLRSFSAPAKK